jgi:hypothetical protein
VASLKRLHEQRVPADAAALAAGGIRLGPDLGMPLYTSREAWNAQRIGAVAIYCSDGRWGDAFDDFCHHCLFLPRYDRLALPGGPAWLTRRETHAPGPYHAIRGQLDFLVQVHGLERVILIAHYGCAFYTEMLHADAEGCLATQREDLRAAAATLREWYPLMTVEKYLAMRQENQLSFNEAK